jgi:hypothetical protein
MSNLNGPVWDGKKPTLHGGMLVEICPRRLSDDDFDTYAALDGCLGTILDLHGVGQARKARVRVISKTKGRSGNWMMLAKALKPVPKEAPKES